jgi:peptide/nickel transport system permease protein
MQRDTQSSAPFSSDNLGNGVLPNQTLATSHDVHTESVAPGIAISAGAETALVPAKKQGFWRTLGAVLTANSRMTIGICIIGFFVLVALVGPLFVQVVLHQSPDVSTNDLSQAPSAIHWLGTTQEGYDLFARLIYGARVSLLSSFSAAIGSTIIAVVVGLVAGYVGGWVDDVLSLLTNIFLVLPGMALAIVIASFAVHGTGTIILVLLFTGWAWGARVLRSQTLSVRQREFVTAARTTGEGLWRIVFYEILPNEIAIVASSFVGTFIYAALAEVAMEFLGLGDINTASWGMILYWAQVHNAVLAGHWWEVIPAGLCVAVLCAGLSCVNFGIDQLANPALQAVGKNKRRKSKKVGA